MSIVLGILLFISCIIIGVLGWYISNFTAVVNDYNEELKSVLEDLYLDLYKTYQSLDYYGDPEIRRLLVHCRKTGTFVIDFLKEIAPGDEFLDQDLQFFNQLIDSEDNIDAESKEE
ncbi:MAG: hypothetical protein CMB97_08185 [Flavobacteriaceae bacterium]|nr:hypothetical protein [Flavobacteriaceae bacterium]